MVIEIRQTMQPISMSSAWQELPFDRVVWRHPAGLTLEPYPEEFVPGLLTGYVDGKQVTLSDLDAALTTIGTNRAAILSAIQTRETAPQRGEKA